MKQRLCAALGAAAALIAAPVGAQLPAGTLAPDFSLRDTTGKTLRLSQFRGQRYVLLDFWASWCPYCREEMPELRALGAKYRQQMVVLGVDTGERGATASARAWTAITAATQLQIDFPVLLEGDRVAEQYQAVGLPATYLIDPEGRIVAAQIGFKPDLWPRVEAVVAAFQPPVTAERTDGPSPRKAGQILHALSFPSPPGPHDWVVGRNVAIRFHRPDGIQTDQVLISVDGKPIATFGPGSLYTWDATTVSNGSHTLRIAAQTAAGRETWAAEQTLIVDNRTPRPAAQWVAASAKTARSHKPSK